MAISRFKAFSLPKPRWPRSGRPDCCHAAPTPLQGGQNTDAAFFLEASKLIPSRPQGYPLARLSKPQSLLELCREVLSHNGRPLKFSLGLFQNLKLQLSAATWHKTLPFWTFVWTLFIMFFVLWVCLPYGFSLVVNPDHEFY